MQSGINIGFIGVGKMGEAIIKGILQNKLLPENNISFTETDTKKIGPIENKYLIKPLPLETLVKTNDKIFICVKPQTIKELLAQIPTKNIKNKLFVSILAGTKIALFQEYLGNEAQIIRVMPNTPATLGKGVSAICFSDNTAKDYQELSKMIFKSLGKIIEVKEDQINIATGISGSGPAFLYRIATSIAKAGEKQGLDFQKSLKLAAQTMIGAGHMLLETGKTPEELITDVSSPNGTTVTGLATYDETNIDNDIKKIINATISRAQELAQ